MIRARGKEALDWQSVRCFLSWCDGLIVCGDVISSGMKKEIEAAEKKQIPIYFYRENRRGFYISTYRKQERKNEMQI